MKDNGYVYVIEEGKIPPPDGSKLIYEIYDTGETFWGNPNISAKDCRGDYYIQLLLFMIEKLHIIEGDKAMFCLIQLINDKFLKGK